MPSFPAHEADSSTAPETRLKPAAAAIGCNAITNASAGLRGIASSGMPSGTEP